MGVREPFEAMHLLMIILRWLAGAWYAGLSTAHAAVNRVPVETFRGGVLRGFCRLDVSDACWMMVRPVLEKFGPPGWLALRAPVTCAEGVESLVQARQLSPVRSDHVLWGRGFAPYGSTDPSKRSLGTWG